MSTYDILHAFLIFLLRDKMNLANDLVVFEINVLCQYSHAPGPQDIAIFTVGFYYVVRFENVKKLYAGRQIAFFTSSCTGGLKEERSNNIDYRYSKLFTMCSLLSVIPHHLIFTQVVSHAQTCEKLFVHRRMDLPVLLW